MDIIDIIGATAAILTVVVLVGGAYIIAQQDKR